MTKENIDKLIIDNENIVYDLGWKFFKKLNKLVEFEELISLARLGLVKAANTYDSKKGYTFATYAYKVIQNEIYIYLRQINKHKHVCSFNDVIVDNIVVEDIIFDDKEFFEEKVMQAELIEQLYIYIKQLNPQYQEIINLRLAGKSQCEIGNIVGLSQAQISRVLKRIINLLRIKFNVRGGEYYGNSK